MLNLNETLNSLVQAEKIFSSSLIETDEKIALLTCLHAQFALEMPGLPAHVPVARGALERMLQNAPRTATSQRKAQGKNGKAKGVEKSPEVASGGTEEGSEAPEGETQGIADQAQDA